MVSPRLRAEQGALHAGGRWTMYLWSIPSSLYPFVYRSCGFVEIAPIPIRRREMPLVGAPLILTFGAPYRLRDARNPAQPVVLRQAFTAGLHETYTTSQTTGDTWSIQIDLTPFGAYRVFGVPMRELTNRTFNIDDVLGADGHLLYDRLALMKTWEGRFDLLDAFLLDRIERGPRESSAIRWSWGQLAGAHGTVDVGLIADELGWSRKRLVAEFREQIGLPPKLVARLLRFHRAAELGRGSTPWADVAAQAGYFDQAHLIRDFRAFAGVSPAELRREMSRMDIL